MVLVKPYHHIKIGLIEITFQQKTFAQFTNFFLGFAIYRFQCIHFIVMKPYLIEFQMQSLN